jgi:ubiquinone/menaquinone biosynthesis C-methylase UbiE
MVDEHRFKGAMSEEYKLIRLALPHFDQLQRLVGEAVANYVTVSSPPCVLDVGCGDGVTSDTILSSRTDVMVTALDNEEKMVEQARQNLAQFVQTGRCRVVKNDALAYLRREHDAGFDIVASVLTLHNLDHHYRHLVHWEIYRVLKPGGLFVNADKYVESDEQRFKGLQVALGRFFDALVPLGKFDLLRDWVLHNVADQGPDRVMKEADAVEELTSIGFRSVAVRSRMNMEALLTALKPS